MNEEELQRFSQYATICITDNIKYNISNIFCLALKQGLGKIHV